MRKESSSVSGNANQIKVMVGRIFNPHRHPYFSYTLPSSCWFHYGSPYKPQCCSNCIKTGPTLRPDEGERRAYSVQEMNITQRTLSADVSVTQEVCIARKLVLLWWRNGAVKSKLLSHVHVPLKDSCLLLWYHAEMRTETKTQK